MQPHDTPRPGLLQRVSRAMFWNAALLPMIALVNLAAAIMIRRGFGAFPAVGKGGKTGRESVRSTAG